MVEWADPLLCFSYYRAFINGENVGTNERPDYVGNVEVSKKGISFRLFSEMAEVERALQEMS